MDIPGLDIFAGCCIMLPCLETLHNISKERELTQIFPKRENNIEMLPNVSGEKTNDTITACYFQREKTCNKDLQMGSSALQARQSHWMSAVRPAWPCMPLDFFNEVATAGSVRVGLVLVQLHERPH